MGDSKQAPSSDPASNLPCEWVEAFADSEVSHKTLAAVHAMGIALKDLQSLPPASACQVLTSSPVNLQFQSPAEAVKFAIWASQTSGTGTEVHKLEVADMETAHSSPVVQRGGM